MFSPKQDQLHVFRQHVRVAFKLKLPLVCHEREAFDDFIKVIKEELMANNTVTDELKNNDNDDGMLPIPIIIHCFTGTEQELREYIKMGFYIGITTFLCIQHRAKELRRCIKSGILPLERLLIETDAPFMKPEFNKVEGNDNYQLITKYFENKRKGNGNLKRNNRFKARNEPCLLPTILNILKMCYHNVYTKKEIAETTMKTSKQIFDFDIIIVCLFDA